MSYQKDPNKKSLIIFRQDEAVFTQFCAHSSHWVGPKQEREFLPKTNGRGIMLSAYQSRELGLGLKISQEDLKEINNSRKGKKYCDIDAAIEIYGKKGYKQPLTCSLNGDLF